MGTIMILIASALFYSLIIFFICEEKSLKDENLSDIKCLVTEEINPAECFGKYNTIQYIGMYFVAVLIFSILISKYVLLPNGYGLEAIMAFTFFPALLGSLIILLVKWRFQPLIKLISSFMFGSFYMAATAIGIAIMYMLNG